MNGVLSARRIIWPMPTTPDLDDDERATLVAVLREVIERNRHFMSPPREAAAGRLRRSYGFDWRSGWPVSRLTGTETCSMVTSQWPSILRYASVTRTVKSSTSPFLFLPETC